MREINAQQITEIIRKLCIRANCHLPEDLKTRIDHCYSAEDWPQGREILAQIVENYRLAERETMPICQDTGMACVFLEIGQDVHFVGGDLREAVDEGITGLLCTVKDADSLYEQMKKMALMSREEREQMGIAGRKLMERQFDKKIVVQNTIDAIFR